MFEVLRTTLILNSPFKTPNSKLKKLITPFTYNFSMTKEAFSYLVTNPNEVSKKDVESLEAILEEYPFFQLAHTLVAKGYHANYAEELANEKIRKAAIYALNRNALRKVINGSFVNENLVPQNSPSTVEYINKVDKIIEQATAEEQPQTFANHDLVAFSASYEDALLDDILNKQQKQLDIINSFIEKDPGLIRTSKSQIDSPVNHIDLSAKSTKAEKEVVTESYAKILTMQGRKEKAVEVYEKLILKFPEKKAYFADKIKAIQ
ncbi:hypothetical protein [Flectobacillus roseus]|uniref:Tetratricopeptide repeat protein n=1 Tax=Flectobacillus roseus TaxID=502259 RepID=A0ABT6Y7C7_9BACT|nr:hypothetical protein [Flectobacillus roseus]MDI9859477.1 hypothetical protein [Flectobacillus roseus]